ncbi:hypothetical protein [Dehalobacter sp. 4CP]|uniref:hypothetical protein n=1 Tax=Dehalobacter sp. CP TaxID=2594474 RepID=UPI0039E8A162
MDAKTNDRKDYFKNYREENKEKLNKYQREWRSEHPEKVKEYQERYWLNKLQLSCVGV